jgi:hypothetical protein
LWIYCGLIIYSQSAEKYKRRRKGDRYEDFRMLPDQADDIVIVVARATFRCSHSD